MRAEWINAFVQASRDMMLQMVGIHSEVGKIYLKDETFSMPNIAIIIGITGGLKGQAVLGIEEKLGYKIASNMMGGMPVAALDDLSKSAISELGNMILGNAATLLYNQNIKIDITPPTLMLGEKLSISANSMQTLCIPINTEYGVIELDIAVKE